MIKKTILAFLFTVCGVANLYASDSKWLTGAAIGAGTGVAGGAGLGYAFAPLCEENKSKCQWQLPLLAGGALAITGGIIGAFVGSMISDEETFAIAPIIAPNSLGGSTFGLNVRIYE